MMRFKTSFLLLAVACFLCSQPSSSASMPAPVKPVYAAGADRVEANALGVPFPRTNDRAAWIEWRQRVSARLLAKRRERSTKMTAAVPAAGSGYIETIAGTAPFQTPTTALKAQLGGETGVVEDAGGNLYIASYGFGAVLKVDSSSNVTVYAGQVLASGIAAQSGDGGPATAARLVEPFGLALDANGDLYISDIGSYTVRKVSGATGIITTIAGTPGKQGFSQVSGPAAAAPLELPSSVALDGNGNLYIGDAETIYEVNLANGMLSIFAGGVVVRNPCSLSVSTTCPAANLTFLGFAPNGIAVGDGYLYLAGTVDIDTPPAISNTIVQIALASGTAIQVPYPTGSLTDIAFPYALALDSGGNLYVADLEGSIQQIPAGSSTPVIVAGGPYEVYGGDGGPAVNASLIEPLAITITPQGNIVFEDTDRIRSIDTSGIISTVVGNGYDNYFGDGGSATAAGLASSDAVTDSLGNVYLADQGNNVVRFINGSTGVITTIAGNGTLLGVMQNGGSDINGDGGPALDAAISYPGNLAMDNAGALYIGGQQGIRKVLLSTGIITTLSTIDQIGGMVFDGQHTLYASDFNQVLAFDLTTGNSTPVAGGGTSSADGVPALTAELSVMGLALDASGNLYFSDENTNTVRVVSLSTGIINTVVGSVTNYRFGYGGDGGPAASASVNNPEGLRYDGAGHLLIADSGNGAIRSVDLATKIITTIAGDGTPGFGGDGANSGLAMLNRPSGITVGPDGNLFLVDAGNDRIRRVVLHPTALTSALATSTTSLTAGGSVTFTATYQGVAFGVAPTGTVTFLDGTVSLGTGTLTAGAGGAFVATLTNSTLAAGMHTITASYGGDAHYAAGVTAAVTVTVAAVPVVPSFGLTANTTAVSLTEGASTTAVLTITPQNAFNQPLTFGCVGTAPAGTTPGGAQAITCTFAPTTLMTNGTAATSTTVTFYASPGSASLVFPMGKPADGGTGWRWLPGSGAAALACLLMVGLPRARRRAWQHTRGLWIAIAGLVLMAGMGLGCGSNSGSGSGGSQSAIYPVEVSATAGTSVSQSVTVYVTVTK